MTTARFNSRFAVRLAAGLLAAAVLVWLLHALQIRRHAAGQLALAGRAEADGDTTEQIAALSRYLDFIPSDTATRARYGLVLAAHADSPRARTRALQVLQQVLIRDPNQHEARVKAVELASAAGETAEALRLLGPALAERPEDAALHVLHARALLDAGQDIQAAAALTRALEVEPGRTAESLRLAEVLHTKLRRPRQAAQALDDMVKHASNVPAALLARAKFRASRGQPEEAAADLQKAIQLDGQDAALRLAWAELSAERGDMETSSTQYRKAAELAPDRPETHLGHAWTLRELGRPADAASALEAGLARLRDHPGLLVALAEVRAEQGRLDDAAALRKRLPPDVKGAGLYIDGLILLGKREWLPAARALIDAIRTNMLPPPLASKALLGLCRAYGALEAPEERLNAARHAQHLADTTPARLERASAALAVGLADEALVQMRGVAARPRVPPSAWLLYARAAVEHTLGLPPWQRAWKEPEDALAKVAPADAAPAAVLRSRVQEAQGLPADARKTLEEQLKRDDSHAEVWLALSALESRQGREGAAAKILAKADGRFGLDVGWLLVRASQLSAAGTPQALRELDDLMDAAARLPASARSRLEWHLIGLHSRAGRLALVERTAEGLLKRHPADPRLHLLLAEARIQAGDDAGAKRRVEAMKKLADAGPYWRVAEAERLLARMKPADARTLLDEALKAAPEWPRAWLVLGRLEDQTGKGKEAIAAYRKALDGGDWSHEPLNRSLQLLLAAGKYAEADGLMERAQRRGVVEAAMLRPAAFIALRAGRVERARELARQAVPPGTRSYRDLVWLGRLLDGSGQAADAEKVLREAIALAPEAAEPRLALARVQKRDRRPDDANNTLTQMAAEVPEERRAVAVARGHELMGRFADAEQALRAFLEAQPRDPEAQRRLADLLLRLNRPADAAPVLESLLATGTRVLPEERPELRRQLALAVTAPGHPPRTALAMSLLKLNDDTEADRRVEALVRGLAPSARDEALRTLAGLPAGPPEEVLRWAHLHDLSGNWPRAREMLLELASADPDNPACAVELVDGLLRNNRRPEAKSWLERLEKLDPKHPRLPGLRKQLEAE